MNSCFYNKLGTFSQNSKKHQFSHYSHPVQLYELVGHNSCLALSLWHGWQTWSSRVLRNKYAILLRERESEGESMHVVCVFCMYINYIAQLMQKIDYFIQWYCKYCCIQILLSSSKAYCNIISIHKSWLENKGVYIFSSTW